MARKEYLSNYIYVLNYEYIRDSKNEEICLHALDTHYMVACKIKYRDLTDLARSRQVVIRNIDEQGISNVVQKDKKVVLFKCDKNSYMVADYYCNLSILSLQSIKEHRDMYPDIKFVGKGLTTCSGKIPNINKRALNIYKMQSFNNKAEMLGISTLVYDFNYNNDIVITGTQIEKERLEIPNFATSIANRAFINSNIKHARIGNNIREISSSAFANCKELVSVNFGDSVEIIGTRAFFRCFKLNKLYINDSLSEIHAEAFAHSGIKELNRQYNTIKVDDNIRKMLNSFR